MLVAILMAHFTVVGGDVNCARHGDRSGGPHHRGAHAGSATAHGVSAPGVGSEQPCETPTQPECCRAMTSCSVSVAVTAIGHQRALQSRERVASAADDAPPSLITAPDPPPPKA
jgi:hypothetical protein